MKYIAFILLLGCCIARGEEINPHISMLLNKISVICGDRWNISLGEDDMLFLNSKEKALGAMYESSYPNGEELYKLHFRFKFVDPMTASEAATVRQNLKTLREQSKDIKQSNMKGYYYYKPEGERQWAHVLKIKKAETQVADIPELKFKSANISVDSSMTSFTPNKNDQKAIQYKADIENIYRLFAKPNS